MQEDNTYYIQLNGKANIPEPLEIGHNWKVESDMSIVSESRKDNEDGTYDVTFKARPVTVKITKDNGEIIKAKDKRSMSQALRNYAYSVWAKDKAVIWPFEDVVYPKMMQKMMQLAPTIIREVYKELEEESE